MVEIKQTPLRATMARLRLRQADAVREAGVSKRGILALCQGESRARETTEAKLLAWLRKYDRRVTLRDIVGPLALVMAMLGAGCASDLRGWMVTSGQAPSTSCVVAGYYRWDAEGGGCATFYTDPGGLNPVRRVATICWVSRIEEDYLCRTTAPMPVGPEGGAR
jgi:hypothetical protein